MKVAFGHKNYFPDVFWAMTIGEFRAMYEGYVESRGGGRKDAERMTRSEFEKLAAQYPDEPAPAQLAATIG